MYLKIDDLTFEQDKVGIDFEYDEDFRNSVAKACGLSYISKKDLQSYIALTVQNIIDIEELIQFRN